MGFGIFAGDREKCLQVGANEYMSKPIILAQLLNQIDHLLGKTTNHENTTENLNH
jgi:DNA-binding response OmpR family regulator